MTTTTIALVFYITFMAFPQEENTTSTNGNRPTLKWEMELTQKMKPEALVENYNIPGVRIAVKNSFKIAFR